MQHISSVVQTKELNACWNMVYRKNLGFCKSESVTAFICGVGRLNYKHVIALAHFKLRKSLLASSNRVLKMLCATHIVSADFMNLCSEYGVTLNLSYGGLHRKFVDSFRRLCDY